METAVWTLRHPKTGRTVSLVGTMHIGDGRYFVQLSEILAALAAGGAEVHVEGIAHRTGDELTGWERARLAEAHGWDNPERSGGAVTALRLESQGELLRLPDGARNIDLSHADLLRRVGWQEYRRLFTSPAGPLPTGFEPLVRAAIRFQLRHHRGIELLRAVSGNHRRVNRVVIGQRNAVAFAAARDRLHQGDVVLVWGADHLPGLARLFERAGYLRHDERWISACA